MVQLTLRLLTCRWDRRGLLQALRSVVHTAMSRPGLLRCGLYEDTSRPGALLYVEEWRSRDDLHREVRSDRFTRLLAVMEAAAARPELELRFIGEIKGIAWVADIRGESEP